jgi:sugar lactone lactonase YvrE
MFIANQGSLSTGGGSISMVTIGGDLHTFVRSLDQSCNGFGTITPAGMTTGFNDNLFVATPGTFRASWISEVTYDGAVSAFGTCAHKQPGMDGNYWGIIFSAGSNGPLLYITDQHNGEVITMTSSANHYKFASGFLSPEGIAMDSSRNIYVANTAGDTVSMVNAGGTFTTTYAEGFNQPADIAFDNNGNMYVSNYAGSSISMVTPAKQLLTYASGIPSPTGITVKDGIVYVASESEGKVYKLLHRTGIYINGLNMPRGLAKGPDGSIYIADNVNNNIYRVDALDSLTSFVADVPSPSWFVFDNIGTTFLTDFSGGNLLKLSVNNKNVFASGMAGPSGVAYDTMNNLFYVNNYLNGTLSVVSGTGNVSTFAVGLSGPMGVALVSPGNFYVANSSNGTISKVVQGSGVSTFAAGFGLPVGITLDTANNLYIADQSAGMIYSIRPDGTETVFARIRAPFGVAFDGNGNLFVSDTENKQIKEIVLH